MPDGGTPADASDDRQDTRSPSRESANGELLDALSSCLAVWQQAHAWETFLEALTAVEVSAMQAGHLALHDVCVMLHERIVQLSEIQTKPDDEQCAVLATWPSFASDWAQSPGEPRMGELLVAFLRHPIWPQPLDDDEAETLGVMLGVESRAYGSESTIEAVIDTMFASGPNAGDSDTDSDAGGEAAVDAGLTGYDGLSGYAKLGTVVSGEGKIVPEVRARIGGNIGFDDDLVEDLGAEMNLDGKATAEESESALEACTADADGDAGARDNAELTPPAPPENEAFEHVSAESDPCEPRPSAFEDIEAAPAELELPEPELLEYEVVEVASDESGLAEPELPDSETLEAAPDESNLFESELPEPEALGAAADLSDFSEAEPPPCEAFDTTADASDSPEPALPDSEGLEDTPHESEFSEPELLQAEATEAEPGEYDRSRSTAVESTWSESEFTGPASREPENPEPMASEAERTEAAHIEVPFAESAPAQAESSNAEYADVLPPEAEIGELEADDELFAEPQPGEPDLAEHEFLPSTPDGQALGELQAHEDLEEFENLDNQEYSDEPLGDFQQDDAYLTEHALSQPELATADIEDSGLLENGETEEQATELSSEIPETANEMIHLLLVEASQIATTLADIMPLATSDSADQDERRESLEHFAEQVERFNGAVELLGLEGLGQVGERFHQNILMLAESADAITSEMAEVLVHMCTSVPEYLEHPTDSIAGGALVSLLTHSCWPQPASSGWAVEVEALLASPVMDIEDEDREERSVRALPQDVSLELPGDVDMEVLDGLLQDLPGQTAEFSRTVETLIAAGTPEDVEVAQRIAHTVKGAANTVGVTGLANLTHHLEDILLAIGKHNVAPGPGLSEVLVRAADCLESMGESLLGQCAPPEDALHTLQSVLDWANIIDNEGVAAVASDAAPAARRPAAEADTRDPAPQFTPAASTPMVRVPAPLVDDLLRLVGETIILSGQIQERLNVTEREAQNMRKQYTLVQQLGQEMEELIDLRDLSLPQQRVVNGESFDALEFDQYNELHTCSRRLVEAATDTKEVGQNIEEHLSALSDMLSDQGRLNRENQEAVLRTRMVEVQTIVPRLQRSVRQASRLTGKAIELKCIGADTLMDSDVLGRLLDPLMHVLRNAVDHGIELEAARLDAGKDATGEIRLAFHREGNHIVVRCEDDGGGLDFDAIREAAKARDMLADNESLSDEELTQLVLRPNFSTRTEATQLSGRGIGLDAVNMQVVGLGGSLRLQSEPGKGCQIIMRLPLTLISTHALLVRVTSHTIAVATRGVEQILHPDAGETSHFGDQATYRMVDAVYPCTTLARLLGLPGERRAAERERCPALLVQSDNGLNVVLVDGVSDSRELVIKSMGQHLPKIRGIAGATILGDGSVTPVLDLPELLREPALRGAERPKNVGEITGIDVTMPYALVVDDSLSARRSLAQFMSDSGFQVRTARDGVEAVKIMQSKQPDLLLVDLEMPRMNGLELTHHVRADDETRDVPIIMITSRSTEKHRKQAKAAGVTQYFTKPYAEEALMEEVYKLCTR